MGVETEIANVLGLGSNEQLPFFIRFLFQSEHFRCQPDGIPLALFLRNRSARESLEVSLAGLKPDDRRVAQDLGGTVTQPSGVLAFELGVSLIHRNTFSSQGKTFSLEGSEVAIFSTFGIVDGSGTAHPLAENPLLSRSGIRSEFNTG
jgi:hypothetical protein